MRERKQIQNKKQPSLEQVKETQENRVCNKSYLEDRFSHEKLERTSKSVKEEFGLPYKYCMKGNSFVINMIFRNKVITLSGGLKMPFHFLLVFHRTCFYVKMSIQ